MNGDGIVDLVTGCFEGGVYVLAGMKDGAFAKPEQLKDKAGRVLRLGQYWDYDEKAWAGVEGSPFKSELGISAFPYDWDGDGDLDLVLGSNSGALFVRHNEGSAKQPAYATESEPIEAGGEPMKVPGGEAMPFLADWDGDGLDDVLCGSGFGGVVWFRNVGKRGAPQFMEAQDLVADKNPGAKEWSHERTQVVAIDHDGDGDLDLLVGDYRIEGGSSSSNNIHGYVWLFRRKGSGAVR